MTTVGALKFYKFFCGINAMNSVDKHALLAKGRQLNLLNGLEIYISNLSINENGNADSFIGLSSCSHIC